MSKAKEQRHIQALIKRLSKNKKGKLIRVRCWTEEGDRSYETHAETMSDAALCISQQGPMHANWLMEFKSEPTETALKPKPALDRLDPFERGVKSMAQNCLPACELMRSGRWNVDDVELWLKDVIGK